MSNVEAIAYLSTNMKSMSYVCPKCGDTHSHGVLPINITNSNVGTWRVTHCIKSPCIVKLFPKFSSNM